MPPAPLAPLPPVAWVELFAGTASLALWLLGCRQPPCGYMGSKRRLAADLGAVAGLRCGLGAGAVLLVDAGPWGRTWETLVGPRGDDVARLLYQWADDCDPFDLWYELCASPEPLDDVEHAAAYLWLQARSASTTPVWWTPGALLVPLPEHLRLAGDGAPSPEPRAPSPELEAGRLRQAGSTSRTRDGVTGSTPWQKGGTLRQASSTSRTAEGVRGHTPWQTGQLRQASAPSRGAGVEQPAWQMGHRGQVVMSGAGARNPRTGELYAKDSTRPATIKGSTRPRAAEDAPASVMMAEKRARGRREKGAIPRSANAERTDGPRKSNGVQTPRTIAARVEAIRSLRWPVVRVLRAHPEPEDALALLELETLVGVVVYLDPPYVGCTPYAVDCPRAEVLRLARAYDAAGAHVLISESVSLVGELGAPWVAVTLTREGKKAEVVTTNRPAAWWPAEQLRLFGAT